MADPIADHADTELPEELLELCTMLGRDRVQATMAHSLKNWTG